MPFSHARSFLAHVSLKSLFSHIMYMNSWANWWNLNLKVYFQPGLKPEPSH